MGRADPGGRHDQGVHPDPGGTPGGSPGRGTRELRRSPPILHRIEAAQRPVARAGGSPGAQGQRVRRVSRGDQPAAGGQGRGGCVPNTRLALDSPGAPGGSGGAGRGPGGTLAAPRRAQGRPRRFSHPQRVVGRQPRDRRARRGRAATRLRVPSTLRPLPVAQGGQRHERPPHSRADGTGPTAQPPAGRVPSAHGLRSGYPGRRLDGLSR